MKKIEVFLKKVIGLKAMEKAVWVCAGRTCVIYCFHPIAERMETCGRIDEASAGRHASERI